MMSSNAEALKEGRAGSLARRPPIANANGASAAPRMNREYEGRKTHGGAARIRMDRISPDSDQPRKTFTTEALDRLAENMRIRGQLVPILVRWNAEADRYIVIDGERRYRAATQAGLPELACVVENEADPDAILEMQLIANALREDVAPVEQARAWDRLMVSQGLTQQQLAEKLGYDRSMIAKSLTLLDLTPEIQAKVDAGAIPASTATVVAQLDPADQPAMAARVESEGMSRAETTAAVRQVARSKPAEQGAATKGRRAKLKLITSRTFKGDGGLRITAERSRGLDLVALADLMERSLEQIRAELAQAD